MCIYTQFHSVLGPVLSLCSGCVTLCFCPVSCGLLDLKDYFLAFFIFVRSIQSPVTNVQFCHSFVKHGNKEQHVFSVKPVTCHATARHNSARICITLTLSDILLCFKITGERSDSFFFFFNRQVSGLIFKYKFLIQNIHNLTILTFIFVQKDLMNKHKNVGSF